MASVCQLVIKQRHPYLKLSGVRKWSMLAYATFILMCNVRLASHSTEDAWADQDV
jgi:hypothetical protein